MQDKYRSAFNKLRNLLSRFGLLLVISVIAITTVNLSYAFMIRTEKSSLLAQQQTISDEETTIVDYVITAGISDTFDDLFVINDSDEFNSYINNPSPTNLENAKQLFYRIAQNKQEFLQIRFIDTSGDEIIRVNNDNGTTTIVGDQNLQNKLDRYYVADTLSLPQNKLYISNLDLNIENGVIQEPYQPVLRFVVSVFDNTNTRKGILIINYDAYDILSIFNEYSQGSSSLSNLGLISGNMIYQFVYNDNSQEYELNIKTLDEDIYNEENTTILNVEASSDYRDSLYNTEPFLQIYSNFDFQQVIEQNGSIFLHYPIIIYIINLLTVAIVFVFGIVLKRRSDDKLLLDANTYLSDTNKDAVLITDYNGNTTYVNQKLIDTFRFQSDELIGKDPRNLINVFKNPNIDNIGIDENTFDEYIWQKTKSGIYIFSRLKLKAIYSLSGAIRFYIATISDPPVNITTVSETKLQPDGTPVFSDNFKELARVFSDRPIKVHQTTMFLIRTREFLNYMSEHSDNNDDITNLKICEYIRANIGPEYMLANPRMGYLMIVCDIDLNSTSIANEINNIRELINQYILSHNIHRSLQYLISADMVCTPENNYVSLIHNAFVAMESLKRTPNQKYLIYHPDMTPTLLRDHQISEELDNGFKHDEFYMNYQVQTNLKDNSIVGVEALLRWDNQNLGRIPPNEFIPKIEKSSYIASLSKMVVGKVIEDMIPYYKSFPKNFRLSVNMTSYDFFNENLMHDIVKLIEDSPIPTKNFCFEITESNYLENTEQTNMIIDYLHKKNIIIALDDFGKGFSALSSLKYINVDKVKIDRVFIKDYPESDDGVLFSTIADLVNSLGLTILVEGTETLDQINLSKRLLCHEHQGFYVSKPLSITDFSTKYLKKNE